MFLSCPCKGWACVEHVLLVKMWASWGFVIILFPVTFNWEPLSDSLGFTIDLFLQGNQPCKPLMQTLGNQSHEKLKGQQMLPTILVPQEQNKKQVLESVVCEEGMVTLTPYQGFLSSFTGFRVLTLTFFQGTLLGRLQRMGSFMATLKL